jgi:hypothetical protein
MNKFLILLTLGFCLVGIENVQAADKNNTQKMQYDVYAGGIHALKASLNIDQSKKNRYEISLAAQTFGLLGRLAPWQGLFKSKGWDTSKGFVPELHQSVAIWRKEEEIKKYHYKKNGKFAGYSLKDDSNDGSLKKVDNKLTQGTSDVLTATLNTMQSIVAHNKCEGSTEVFDGKRRFEMIFKEKRKVELTASRWNVYSGPAIECSVEVAPVAGKWREKPRGWMSIQEQGRERGTMPTVWFAQMEEGQVAIPIKVKVKTSYGTLFMHLTHYETAGQKIALK